MVIGEGKKNRKCLQVIFRFYAWVTNDKYNIVTLGPYYANDLCELSFVCFIFAKEIDKAEIVWRDVVKVWQYGITIKAMVITIWMIWIPKER